MGIKYISGFRGLDHAKQHLRRSVHLGSALTSGYTVLNPAEARYSKKEQVVQAVTMF